MQRQSKEDGMEAARPVGAFNLGVGGIKLVSQMTAHGATPAAQILGGAQFNSSFANFTLQEGCPSKFPPNASDPQVGCSIPSTCMIQACIPVACIPQACLAPGITPADITSFKTLGGVLAMAPMDLISPEQAEYNVLRIYFEGTAAASVFGATQGAAPLNYLQIYSPDIVYATGHVNVPAQVVETGGASVAMSAQDLLNLASLNLSKIGEPVLLPPSPTLTAGTLANGATYAAGGLVPGSWAQVKGTGLSSSMPRPCTRKSSSRYSTPSRKPRFEGRYRARTKMRQKAFLDKAAH